MDIEYKPSILKNLRYRGASISKYLQYRSFFISGCFRYGSMPTSISKYRLSISKLHIVPDIKAKPLTFDIEGLVFDIVHILISGNSLRNRSLARFQMLPSLASWHLSMIAADSDSGPAPDGPGPDPSDRSSSDPMQSPVLSGHCGSNKEEYLFRPGPSLWVRRGSGPLLLQPWPWATSL